MVGSPTLLVHTSLLWRASAPSESMAQPHGTAARWLTKRQAALRSRQVAIR